MTSFSSQYMGSNAILEWYKGPRLEICTEKNVMMCHCPWICLMSPFLINMSRSTHLPGAFVVCIILNIIYTYLLTFALFWDCSALLLCAAAGIKWSRWDVEHLPLGDRVHLPFTSSCTPPKHRRLLPCPALRAAMRANPSLGRRYVWEVCPLT